MRKYLIEPDCENLLLCHSLTSKPSVRFIAESPGSAGELTSRCFLICSQQRKVHSSNSLYHLSQGGDYGTVCKSQTHAHVHGQGFMPAIPLSTLPGASITTRKTHALCSGRDRDKHTHSSSISTFCIGLLEN